MKYLELIGNIKTIFEKQNETVCVSELSFDEIDARSKESIEIIRGKQNNENVNTAPASRAAARLREIKSNNNNEEFIKKLNNCLGEFCNEDYCLFASKINIRTISILVKINDETNVDSYMNEIKNIVKTVFENNINDILIKNENEKEIYIDVEFELKEAEIKDFYFNGIMDASRFGLDINKYIDNIKYNVNSYNRNFLSYDKISEYLYEYNIPKKLTKDEFYEKYQTQLINKSFKAEIDRIYNSSNINNININPVHYEFTEYDGFARFDMAKALATALYSVGRIKSNKVVKFNIEIYHNYINNEVLYMLIRNLKDSFVLFDIFTEKNNSSWSRAEYANRTGIRTKELTDNIIALKDEVQFAFYIDKYQDKVRSGIIDELYNMNIVKFDDKLNPDKVMDYIKQLADKSNVEIDQKLINMVEMSKNDMTIQNANDLFDNYKQEKIKNEYFVEYKNYFDGRGNVDNYIDPYEKLMNMTGLHNVKKVVNEIINFNKINNYKLEHFMEFKNIDSIKNSKYSGVSIPNHMIFMGNPGTCKTTVAKMIAKIFKSRGIIKNDRTEIYGVDGKCIYLENAFKYAYGGVLFIDEAYKLNPGEITDLVALMENHRNDVMVILAGYTYSMKNFLHRNEGLTSRFNYLVEFEDYTEDELWEILKYQVKEEHLIMDENIKEKVMPIFMSSQTNKEMGNGRLVRKMLQMAMTNQASRLSNIDLNSGDFNVSDLNILTSEDFNFDYKKLTGVNPPKIIGHADPEIEFDNMIGISNIKNIIKKSIAASYMNKIRKETFDEENKNFVSTPMHLAFLGNPGTAKTTVARLVARILKKKGIIKKENILEVGRKDLVGQFVGSTAPLVKSVFERAKGGVLFIDEAYSLVEDRAGSFGDEAINTIIAEMENNRDDVMVIFAGYTDRMREFISRNEGLRSRLSFVIEFDDYTSDELYQIFEKMISDNQLIVSTDAKDYVKNLICDVTKEKDFGNGRFVRKLIDNAKLNMDYRLAALNKTHYTFEELKTLVKEDFEDLEDDKVLDRKEGNIVGFVA